MKKDEEKFYIELNSKRDLDVVKLIIDRANPVEPLVTIEDEDDKEYIDVFCPICDNPDLFEGQNFCGDCGKALDWTSFYAEYGDSLSELREDDLEENDMILNLDFNSNNSSKINELTGLTLADQMTLKNLENSKNNGIEDLIEALKNRW